MSVDSTQLPNYHLFFDVAGTIRDKDSGVNTHEEARRAFFISFVDLMDELEEKRMSGLIDYHITVIDYSTRPGQFKQTIDMLSLLLQSPVTAGQLDNEYTITTLNKHIPKADVPNFLQKHRVVVLKGDYALWKETSYSSEGGKPFIVGQNSLFFDNNLIRFQNSKKEWRECCIVHPFDEKMNTVEFDNVKKLCHQVDTERARTESDYFIKLVRQSPLGNPLVRG